MTTIMVQFQAPDDARGGSVATARILKPSENQ